MNVDHCHAVLVEHADGTLACLVCATPTRFTHDFVEPCGDGCCWPAIALPLAA